MLKLAVAASLLLVVAGCSDPEPKEPRPTASPTPTITAPTMPAQAKEDTPEGAAAFVGHYVAVFNYASNTGDVGPLERLSSPTCKGCLSYIDLYRETYANGGFFKDSDWALSDLDVRYKRGKALIFGTVTAPAGTYAEDKHSSPALGNATNADLTFVVRARSGNWILDTLELQASR